jgi:NAD(P)-dependent dehydrogenase (short-subunit alcohol dehydrogenase family)
MPATIVLITGANQGIGYFAALQLAQLPGYHVLAGSRDVAKGVEAVKKIKAEGVRSAVETIQLDVDLDASIDAAVNLIAKRFGKLDALVVCLHTCARERHELIVHPEQRRPHY